jgi:hypothetical protein
MMAKTATFLPVWKEMKARNRKVKQLRSRFFSEEAYREARRELRLSEMKPKPPKGPEQSHPMPCQSPDRALAITYLG